MRMRYLEWRQYTEVISSSWKILSAASGTFTIAEEALQVSHAGDVL